MAADERNMPFIKNLASSGKFSVVISARETTQSPHRSPDDPAHLPDGVDDGPDPVALDHLKLWKGLFYALWMADRPIPQQNLCAELAALVGILPDDAVVPFLRAFWETLSREWTGIDVLRMEKFMLLVRRVLGASFAWAREGGSGSSKKNSSSKSSKNCKNNKETRAEAMLALLREWPIEEMGDLAKVSVGLRLHVLDIWVDEVERAGMTGEDATEDDAQLLEGVKAVVENQIKSPSKPCRARAKEGLADERLPWNEKTAEDEEMGEDGEETKDAAEKDGWGGFDD
ncbi:ribosomal RNA-processing protein 1 [Apiospora phragmitis]|uniref:Ribosomal RNA-processing protein 1 n=1 Tax=Apiospora phragmitis TaxID=2905665 RepID=A0ABR1VFK6_9PEZI